MVINLLVEHAWITTVAFMTAISIGPAVGYRLAVRPSLAKWLGSAGLLPIAALTLLPTGRDMSVGCATEWGIPTFGAIEVMANVVLFIPAVLLLGVAIRRPWVVCLGAIAASGLIEVTQAFVPALGRSCSTYDWLANAIGSAIGAGLAALALRLRGPMTTPSAV